MTMNKNDAEKVRSLIEAALKKLELTPMAFGTWKEMKKVSKHLKKSKKILLNHFFKNKGGAA